MDNFTEGSSRRAKRRKTNNISAPSWESTRHFQSKPQLGKSTDIPVKDNHNNQEKKLPSKFSVNPKLTVANKEQKKNDNQNVKIETQNVKKDNKKSSKKSRKRARQELESYVGKLEKVEELKAEVANIASQVIANPEEKYNLLSDLRKMAQHAHGKSVALIILTESQLYKDIAPSYRIRSITEKEAEVKVSKEVARIRTFEQSLSNSYQSFIRSCVSCISWRHGQGTKTKRTKDMAIKRQAACKALSELLVVLPHFNEADVIANAVCSLTQDREEEIRKQSSQALKQVLEYAHRSSGQTLQICIQISKQLATIASGKARVVPEEVITPLISIRFVKFPLLPPSTKAKNEPKKSKRYIKKRRRKPEKEIEGVNEDEIEKDMQEGYAEASAQEIFRAKKQLLDNVCHAYFNVIKVAADSVDSKSDKDKNQKNRKRKPPAALAAVLKGLLHMATFIKTNVMESILDALVILIEDGNLPTLVRFRCLSAAYAVLGVHSKEQKSDPDSFVRDAQAMDASLYRALLTLYNPESSSKDEEIVTIESIETILAASAYRRIPTSRQAALSRRLSCMSAALAPTHNISIGLLKAAQTLMSPSLVSPIFKQAASRVDKCDGMDVGLVEKFDMNANDPEIAGAERSAAWELSCLQHHFHPTVRAVALKCAQGFCGSRLPANTEDIVHITLEHSTNEGGFNPTPQSSLRYQSSKQKANKVPYDVRNSQILQSKMGKEELTSFLSEDKMFPADFLISRWNAYNSNTDHLKGLQCS